MSGAATLGSGDPVTSESGPVEVGFSVAPCRVERFGGIRIVWCSLGHVWLVDGPVDWGCASVTKTLRQLAKM
ncbi:hypothetical protein PR003_g20754 [Phytophthora rubi]|uniref:Uncharacterized protein n=1 Tax=Phytophthora rubi TaxID=129364 RepID=A0A6A4DK53_9STRA|nr:hypothetical protein PR003_g20754 [Phytophthora rubi]